MNARNDVTIRVAATALNDLFSSGNYDGEPRDGLTLNALDHAAVELRVLGHLLHEARNSSELESVCHLVSRQAFSLAAQLESAIVLAKGIQTGGGAEGSADS